MQDSSAFEFGRGVECARGFGEARGAVNVVFFEMSAADSDQMSERRCTVERDVEVVADDATYDGVDELDDFSRTRRVDYSLSLIHI